MRVFWLGLLGLGFFDLILIESMNLVGSLLKLVGKKDLLEILSLNLESMIRKEGLIFLGLWVS